MKKTRLLFVIHRLDAGGAEKSLISLLNSLPLDLFDIDLMAINPNGIFRNQIPEKVHLITASRELICKSEKITSKRFWQYTNIKTLLIKVACILGDRLRSNNSKKLKSRGQFDNDIWKSHIPDCKNEYDVAISYMDGVNYYVIDHVKAKRKILWCHNDYNKLEYKPEYDEKYYGKAYKVCTISDVCKKSLVENFPKLSDNFKVVENISSARIINTQAKMHEEMKHANDGFAEDRRLKIVSIGRLSEQKGFDYAVEAAKAIKDKGLEFGWYVLGEGPLRSSLEEQANDCGVKENIKFIGIRSNPYPYIKDADLYVMPSRYEGKSIALDEAKILCKPIVVTNYPSVGDAIINGKNGLIVDINAQAIANGIMKLYNNKGLREELVSNLKQEDCSNEKQVVAKFLELVK
ncbi:putative uncharacterized protein [Prevotella sp. CAG:255]|uniref:glycosyltransferase n=1 Tax=Prevotella sp. CAG:255 TaxID=1262923 RepID=UPI00034043E8|nr:glycosyltransferase [Prevotella sp. CAG:255]CCX68428.1 putative uncharacterized protein [Prevotella sp. CAG:255]